LTLSFLSPRISRNSHFLQTYCPVALRNGEGATRSRGTGTCFRNGAGCNVRTQRILLAALLSVVSPRALADFYDQPFALRLFLAVDRQSNYASTLARQASLAVLDGASANPGAASWRESPEPSTTVTGSFIDAPSAGGRRVVAVPVTMRAQSPEQGTLALAYAYTDTPQASGYNGLIHSLRSDELIGSYGKHVGERTSAGFTVRVTNGEIVGESYAGSLGNQTVRTTTTFVGPDVSVGLAEELDSRLSAGLVAGYGNSRATTKVTAPSGLNVAIAPGIALTLPPDTLIERTSATIATYSLRAGVGVRPWDATGIYFDANALYVTAGSSGPHALGRFALGVEHHPAQGWTLGAGVGVDTTGQVNWSGGVGVRLASSLDVQFAFQNNAAPEVNPEIGRTRLYMGTLAWSF
jgi:hypothetical protein